MDLTSEALPPLDTQSTTEARLKFLQALDEISPLQNITYYDFLIIAKQLELRFQESSHLMALKYYFMRNNNILNKQKLAEILVVNQKVPKGKFPGKTIVKFILPQSSCDSIKEATEEDEGGMNFDHESYVKRRKKPVSGKYNTIQYSDRLSLIVKMQVSNTMKKVEILNKSIRENSFFGSGNDVKQSFTFDGFKKKVQKAIGEDKIKEDQLKIIFYLLDANRDGIVTKSELIELANLQFVSILSDFYRARVNPELIKSTEFRRGNESINSLHMYKAKNPWTIELSDIQESILSYHKLPQQSKRSTKPRFGPLRHFNLLKPRSHKLIPESPARSAVFEPSKIEKLLRKSRYTQRRPTNPNQTIASKLRRLFVQKVILPRQKMFEEIRYKNKRSSSRSFQVRNDKV